MNSKKILNKLFNSKSSQKGGEKDTEYSVLIKLVIVILILFFIYSYYENRNNTNGNNTNVNSNFSNNVYEKESNNNTNNTNNNNNNNTNNNNNNNNNTNNNNNNNNNTNNNNNNNNNNNTNNNNSNNQMEIIRPPPSVAVGQDLYGILRNYDYKTYNDDLTPPRKRDDYMIPAHVVDPYRFGIYTRGGPTAFKRMGYLSDPSGTPGQPYKFLTLMGRQKYYNSTQYEYYVVSTNKDESLKFELDNYKRELFSGDKVTIPQLNNTQYDVNIDKNLDYEYSPYIV
jgi:DNA mismatch repair ATPase MutL